VAVRELSRIAFIDAKCRKRGSKAGFTDGLVETGSKTEVARRRFDWSRKTEVKRLGRAMAVETSVEVLEITLGTT
jgi:hypothetical protein